MLVKYVVKVLAETTPNTRMADATMDENAKAVYGEGDPIIPDLDLTRRERYPMAAFSGYKVVEHFKAWGFMKFSIETPLPLNVVSFDGSDIDIMLKSSGHSRASIYQTPGDDQTPVVGYEFAPQTGNTSTMSIDIVGTENKFKGHGGKAAMKLTAKAGDPLMIMFDVSAAFDDVEDGTFTPPFLNPTTSAMIDENDIYGHVKIGTTEGTATRAQIDEFTLDTIGSGQVVQKKNFSVNAFRVADFFPTVQVKGDVDTENPYSVQAVLDGDAKAFVVTIKDKDTLSDPQDPTTGKVKWEIIVPTMTPDRLQDLTQRDGLGYLDNLFNANPTSGNDNYVIRYYI